MQRVTSSKQYKKNIKCHLEYVTQKKISHILLNNLLCVYIFYDSHHMPVRLKASLKVQRTRLQYAAWLGNTTSLVIVVDNDIYLKQSPSDEDDIRITNTGKPDLIYNGVPDWLYQGEYNSKLSKNSFLTNEGCAPSIRKGRMHSSF